MRVTLSLFALLAFSAPTHAAGDISHGRFQQVKVHVPQDEIKQVVLFLTSPTSKASENSELVTAMVKQGAMVAEIPLSPLFQSLEKDGAACVYPDGDLENLSHFIQASYHLPTYHVPLLVGNAEGGGFTYAMLAQAPSGTFASAVSVGFCSRLSLRKPMCKGEHLMSSIGADGRLILKPAKGVRESWIVMPGESHGDCSVTDARKFISALPHAELVNRPKDLSSRITTVFARLASDAKGSIPPPPADLSDLPVIEQPGQSIGDTFALVLSGDGGWAGIDKEVAAALNARGLAVVGMDSLRYFWTARTPESIAADVDRVIRYYLSRWNKKSVMLVGYSQGADVLPFAVNRLPLSTRASVKLLALMGLADTADFEFHLSNWVGSSDPGVPIKPEMDRISKVKTLCIYGEEEDDSLCPKLDVRRITLVKLPGGHHFSGDYAHLAEVISQAAGLAAP